MEELYFIASNPLHDGLVIIAIALTAIGGSRLLKQKELNQWVQVEAVICSIKENMEIVLETESVQSKYYYPCIDYLFNYDAKDYKSKNVAFDKKSMWLCEVDKYGVHLKDKDKFWCAWKKGTGITVFVNPDYPGQSVIINDYTNKRKYHNQILVIAGLVLGII